MRRGIHFLLKRIPHLHGVSFAAKNSLLPKLTEIPMGINK